MEEFRVCESTTTGLFYYARFLGDVVHPDHDPTWQAPHHSFTAAYGAALTEAKAAGLSVATKRVKFQTWPDIWSKRPVVKPPKKGRGKK